MFFCCRRRRVSSETAGGEKKDYPALLGGAEAVAAASGKFLPEAEVDRFRQAAKRALSAPPGQEAAFSASLEAALDYVQVLVQGVVTSGGFRSVQHATDPEADGPSMAVTLNSPVRGEIATRSRVPWIANVQKQGLRFTLSRAMPTDCAETACPFRCKCHARCTSGTTNTNLDGWGELEVSVDGTKRSISAMTPVVTREGVLDGFKGAPMIAIAFGKAKAEITRATAQGKVVIVGLGDGEASKEEVVGYAQAAGASGVVCFLDRIPDPYPDMERQLMAVAPGLVMVRQEEGRALAKSVRAGQEVISLKVCELSDEEEAELRRKQDEARALPHSAAVWLRIEGLVMRPVDGHMLLWDETGRKDITSFTPERLWDRWVARRDAWLPNYKVCRIIGSGINKVAKFVPSSRAPLMLGCTTMSLLGMSDQEMTWLRFEPKDGGVSVCGEMREIVDPHAEAVGTLGGQKLFMHELARATRHFQIKVMANPNLIRFGYRLMPSYCHFAWCFSCEASGLPPADAAVFIKLFTPCKGPVCDPCGPAWQQADRTWQITDVRNWRGELQTQGRMLWESTGTEPEPEPDARGVAASRAQRAKQSAWSSCLPCLPSSLPRSRRTSSR
eukprot:TRINITY_DN15359_c0_g1_i1.p1 TRINITY_DN15359_c0_g1~~TRINITY_DN15359_c0_g1_i1.p1  ORF type:complete len:614 (-),score=95.13 TRINITY_DN15359_c0_g1_i1:69-1910(-)